MRVFVTGATGWVGSHVVGELIDAGHDVVGLSRSTEKMGALTDRGATALHGTLDDLDLLQRAARDADAVMHLAFNHDFANFAENGAQDRRAIEAMGGAIVGTDKPMFVTSGVALLHPGHTATEDDMAADDPRVPRQSEQAAKVLADRGVRVSVIRLSPTTHGIGEAHGFVPILIDTARKTGISAHVGDGANRWPAVHVTDAARLYRLALERNLSPRAYHAVAEEGIAFRAIAEAIGRKLDLPVEPRDASHFGWFATFAAADIPASSVQTRQALDWTPTGPALLRDIASPAYYPG